MHVDCARHIELTSYEFTIPPLAGVGDHPKIMALEVGMALNPEIEAMSTVFTALEDLDRDARIRVLRWVSDKLKLLDVVDASIAQDTIIHSRAVSSGVVPGKAQDIDGFRDFPDLFDAARPKSDIEKALVAGYWIQFGQQNTAQEFASQTLNSELKQLGHPVGNITQALSALIESKPGLVQQLRKEGSSKQARKTYRLTTAGRKRVESMCSEAVGEGEG